MTLAAGYGLQLAKDKRWEELTPAEQVKLEGGVWWCKVVYGSVWWCMVVYGGVWWCIVVYGGVWSCMVV